MAMYSVNKPNRTISLHKEGCHRIPASDLSSCGCGITSNLGNHQWWCEEHIFIEAINRFMNNRQWAVILCYDCFAER